MKTFLYQRVFSLRYYYFFIIIIGDVRVMMDCLKLCFGYFYKQCLLVFFL